MLMRMSDATPEGFEGAGGGCDPAALQDHAPPLTGPLLQAPSNHYWR